MLSGIVAIVLLVLFVGLWIWAWRPARKLDFDDAARLALDDADHARQDRNNETGNKEPRQ